MKVILIFLFTFIGMMVVNFSMNLLVGETFKESLFDMLGPFWVMEPIEHVLAYGSLICVLAYPIFVHFMNSQKKGKSR
ncbi:MAG TPA: hypothetical protein VF199_00665 [Bacillales bacterium]